MLALDKEIFVQNIKKYCSLRGVKPTNACRESGAGADLINQIERRGSVPSVERVQLLARYLDVTTSELLGEVKPPGARDSPAPEGLDELTSIYCSLNDEGREKLLDYADDLVKSGKYIKTGTNQLDKAKDA